MRVVPCCIVAAALLVAGCATSQRAYVAPTMETVVSSTEERQSDPPLHLIFVENHSTVPVVVFSVALNACQNIKPQCGPHAAKLRVRPGMREVAARVEPANKQQGFSYTFSFSWHADSSMGTAALAALASNGDPAAQERIAAKQRDDSIQRSLQGPRYNELSRDDFTVLGARVAALRAQPDSLVLEPGQRANIAQIQLLLADGQGQILGRTRWVRWFAPTAGTVQFAPPDEIIARRPGRSVFRFSIADEAQRILTNHIAEIEYPVVVAYRADPHAPVYSGLAVDADSKTPLNCLRAALEDSAENVVAETRTDATGAFYLNSPRPGTYRVRLETVGWAPVYGPSELANADETKEHQYVVRFTDQMLTGPYRDDSRFAHAHPTAVSTTALRAAPRTNGAKQPAAEMPVIQGVTLGGSESMPILGIIGRAPAGTTWIQFVVDSAGVVDAKSIILPPPTDKMATASVASVLPRVRFAPARQGGKRTCEMLRMQVNFSPK
jgi:hypothetical protein